MREHWKISAKIPVLLFQELYLKSTFPCQRYNYHIIHMITCQSKYVYHFRVWPQHDRQLSLKFLSLNFIHFCRNDSILFKFEVKIFCVSMFCGLPVFSLLVAVVAYGYRVTGGVAPDLGVPTRCTMPRGQEHEHRINMDYTIKKRACTKLLEQKLTIFDSKWIARVKLVYQ